VLLLQVLQLCTKV